MFELENSGVSIIIVNYNTCDLLRNCLSSIFKFSAPVEVEVIVVDNDSHDASEEMVKKEFPEVRWIQTGYNAGFGRANNHGIRAARGKYALILNSDTEFFEGTLPISLQCHQALESKGKVGVSSCAMVDDTGKVLFNSNIETSFFTKLWYANPLVIACRSKVGIPIPNIESMKLEQHIKSHESRWIGGAFLLFNAKLLREKNLLLDEDFFMYGEDIEWCERMRRHGLHHYFYTDTKVLHYDGGSPNPSKNRLAQVSISSWLCMKKVKGNPYFFFYFMFWWINFFLDEFLYGLAKFRRTTSLEEDKAKEERAFMKSLVKSYFWRIALEYQRIPSTAKKYLKYAH